MLAITTVHHIAPQAAPPAPPAPRAALAPLILWFTPGRNLAIRLLIALAFLAGLGAALAVLAPPPAGPVVRLALPPALPDPAALLPYLPATARAANTEMPVQPPTTAAPALYLVTADPAVQARALDCLAAAAWYEAGDDPPGMRAVVQVVLNRARHPAFPASVCGVVFQGSERTTGCQFSFTCDGSIAARHPGFAAWARARAVAAAALSGAVDARVGLATHYHADYVVPVWRNGLVKLAQVGLHLFYRWPGNWGTPTVLRTATSGEEPRMAALAALSPVHGPGDGPEDGPINGLASGGAGGDPAALAGLNGDLSANAAPLAYLPLDDADSLPRPGVRTGNHSGALTANGGNPAGTGQAATSRIVLMLDPAAFPGTYAMRALAACAERERCAVVGELLGHAAKGAPGTGPGFVYVRDRRTGAEGAWWDCRALPRANPARCLPQGSALARLLAQWR